MPTLPSLFTPSRSRLAALLSAVLSALTLVTASVSDDDGNRRSRDQLALGMVVDVDGGAVTTAADGVTLSATATTVRTRRALLGPAGAIHLAGASLRVLGQQVLVTTRVQASAPETVRGFELKGTAATLVGYTGTLEVQGRLSADRQALEASTVEFQD